MAIPRPSTNVIRLAACAAPPNRRMDLTVAPHLRNALPARTSAAANAGTMGAASCGHGRDSAMPCPTAATLASSSSPTPARPNHRNGARFPVNSQRRVVTRDVDDPRVSVAATTSTRRAPADLQQPGRLDCRRVPHVAACDQRDDGATPDRLWMRFQQRSDRKRGRQVPHLVGQDDQFVCSRVETARRLDELHDAPPDPPPGGTLRRIAESATGMGTRHAAARRPNGCPTHALPAERSMPGPPRAAVRSACTGIRLPDGAAARSGWLRRPLVTVGFPTTPR